MYTVFKKLMNLLLISTILLMGCAYTPKIIKPADINDKSAWLEYYQDQFKAHGNEVTPPANKAPDVQKKAYQEAKSSWESLETRSTIIGIILLVISLGGLLNTIQQM